MPITKPSNQNYKLHNKMLPELNFKNHIALVFNHGLDMLVKITDIMIAVCL